MAKKGIDTFVVGGKALAVVFGLAAFANPLALLPAAASWGVSEVVEKNAGDPKPGK